MSRQTHLPDFSVFTITLLVASRQLLSSAAGEQVVADTMANASLLGLVIWSVIIITLNTWDKSIRVVESWFNQHCKSRQSTNLKTLAFFQAERCAILDGASGVRERDCGESKLQSKIKNQKQVEKKRTKVHVVSKALKLSTD